uniref:Uncharacterized protein n=1 Tax=Melanopsichium pennsylvanicum 4 TaxID=1398559 RepID=A0A077R8W4_9BASI|nr:uncharacterized protein BN887_06118 [Melanopsichium pennsylvanicum 4]
MNVPVDAKSLTELVGTVGRSGGVSAGQLVQHPRRGSVQALKVVLGAANHYKMKKEQRAGRRMMSMLVQKDRQMMLVTRLDREEMNDLDWQRLGAG